MGNLDLSDTLLIDGLTDPFHKVHMGNTGKYSDYILFFTCILRAGLKYFLRPVWHRYYNDCEIFYSKFSALLSKQHSQSCVFRHCVISLMLLCCL